jgi:2-hydroxy-3-keto-5-methylthiopentenyl-1-phosphate phosphatase
MNDCEGDGEHGGQRGDDGDGGARTVGPGAPVILACDFDGTVVVEDVTDLIWTAHLPYDWATVLMPASRDGAITPFQLIARGYADVAAPPEALLAEVRPQVHLRAGFEALVAACGARGWPVHVISHGLDFYLRALLPAAVPFTAFTGTFSDGRWAVALPSDIAPVPGQDFKVHVLDRLRARHPGHTVVFAGDGRLDLPAARHADRVFAVRGSALAAACRREGIAHTEFAGFDEVLAALVPPAPPPPAGR